MHLKLNTTAGQLREIIKSDWNGDDLSLLNHINAKNGISEEIDKKRITYIVNATKCIYCVDNCILQMYIV